MHLLYSNVPPLVEDGSDTLPAYVEKYMDIAECIYIAVGYVSKKSLNLLSEMVMTRKGINVILVMGMYCIEGFPEGIYNTAIEIDKKWREEEKGEIRVTPEMKYHGKIYGFYKNGKMISGIVGSHNLGAISVDSNNSRQYELSLAITDEETLVQLDKHFQSVCIAPISIPIGKIKNVLIKKEKNKKLEAEESVYEVSESEFEVFESNKTAVSFVIPLKVPGMPETSNDYMKSNVNKGYAKGRKNTKTNIITKRDWWETEIIVGKKITSNEDYPEEGIPFYVVTDDGWRFKIHVSGANKKNFESHSNLKVLGYWLKGCLVAAGVVEPVTSPEKDLENRLDNDVDIYKECKGVVTYQKLKMYGKTNIVITKTSKKLADENGEQLDVWMLSFI